MPSIQGEHRGRAAIIDLAVLSADGYVQHKQSSSPVLSGVRPFRALIDTGATRTMVSPHVVRSVGLQPVGRMPFNSLTGFAYCYSYLFHVAFYGDRYSQYADEDNDAVLNSEIKTIHVFKQVINGGEMTEGQSFDVLLGMDVISSGDLQFTRDGWFRFTF